MPKSATHTQGGYIPEGSSYISNVVNQPDNLADIAVSNLVATGPLTRASVSSIVSDKFIRGSGAPNGVVSAVVGTLYVDTAKTLGAAVWRKDSGTGNTGWVVTEGDTGWRAIAPSTSGMSGKFMVRRVNNSVYMADYALSLLTAADPAIGTVVVGTVPTGFRQTSGSVRYLYGQNGSTPNKLIAVNAGGVLTAYSVVVGTIQISMANAAITEEQWPTSLPGIAA